MKNYYTGRVNSAMREGWTLIELVFIIVVIGILAMVAMAKLSTTRDDAMLSTDVSNMNICIKDMGVIYTATGTALNDINSSSCQNIACYTIDINQTHMVVDLNTSAPRYCDDVQNVGGHLIRTYQFVGKVINR